jgi:phospholipid/cholesterol/gamma-HCH transport system permease protein
MALAAKQALTVERSGAETVLRFAGPLDVAATAQLWSRALREAAKLRGQKLTLDLAGVPLCDTAGATLLLEIERLQGAPVTMTGATEKVAAVLAQTKAATAQPTRAAPPPAQSWRSVLSDAIGVAVGGVAFLGEVVVAWVRLPSRLRLFRLSDLLRQADQAGVQAVPLVVLLGTLIGLILAFQSLIPMRQFGADIYVASLVAIGLVRELGPLLAAVVLAGRSGSAFAAEIGTMKVNQELDALDVMGLDPVTMLVLPRLLAGLVVAPMLTVVMNFSGLIGMSLVLVGDGIPLVAIGNQVAYWVVPKDVWTGLGKAALFGAVVAAIGCRAGLNTGVGPRAVGLSATAAVVGGIVAAIVLDGGFAVLFYQLGI